MNILTERDTGRDRRGGLQRYACDPGQSRGRLIDEPESQTRSPYQRDRDRIIHSGAFRKLKYKTQVFVYHEGDYYRTRLTHTIEVAQIARTLSRALGLNEDLAEAVALSHDLGHTPFAHAGEDALKPLMEPYGGFDHNEQAFLIVTDLERKYAAFDGLNLSWETLEGLVKHNGPMTGPLAKPGKILPASIEKFSAAWDLQLGGFASLEAQVAAIADDIAYMNHDLDDGLRAGLFALDELRDLPLVGALIDEVRASHPDLHDPARLQHETIRRLIDAMVTDLLAEIRGRIDQLRPQSPDDIRNAGQTIAQFSPEMQVHEKVLRGFLWERMYRHPMVNRMSSKARRTVRDLFNLFMEEPETLPVEWQQRLLPPIGPQAETHKARLVADYIAGMTDRYAILEHQRLFDLYQNRS
jgi:dGTPase